MRDYANFFTAFGNGVGRITRLGNWVHGSGIAGSGIGGAVFSLGGDLLYSRTAVSAIHALTALLIGVLLSLVLWIGISFEMPLVLMFLAWMGLVTPAILLRSWRIAVVMIAILAAAITPTVDPFNMGMVMAPLLILYLLSILLSIFPYQARRRRC